MRVLDVGVFGFQSSVRAALSLVAVGLTRRYREQAHSYRRNEVVGLAWPRNPMLLGL